MKGTTRIVHANDETQKPVDIIVLCKDFRILGEFLRCKPMFSSKTSISAKKPRPLRPDLKMGSQRVQESTRASESTGENETGIRAEVLSAIRISLGRETENKILPYNVAFAAMAVST